MKPTVANQKNDANEGSTARRRRVARRGRMTSEAWILILIGIGLLGLGLVMTFSASFVTSARAGDPFAIFQRQLVGAVLGAPVAFAAATFDYRKIRPFASLAMIVSLVSLIAVLVLADDVNGVKRWLEFGPIRVQPAEMVKLVLPVYTATMVAKEWDRIRNGDVVALLWPSMVPIIMAAGLVAVSPDIESALLVAVIGLAPLFVAGLPYRLIWTAVAVVSPLAVYSIVSTPYRLGRIHAWLDPTSEAFRDGYGYQATQGLIALGNGGVFGVGLGQGRGKWLYVPNAETDFIFAIIGEELGMVGAIIVIAAFCALGVFGFRVAERAPDMFGKMLAAGITTWLLLQAVINISSVIGVLPVTGVTLPLVSFGGSSLIVSMVGVGLLVSVARRSVSRSVALAAEGDRYDENENTKLDFEDLWAELDDDEYEDL